MRTKITHARRKRFPLFQFWTDPWVHFEPFDGFKPYVVGGFSNPYNFIGFDGEAAGTSSRGFKSYGSQVITFDSLIAGPATTFSMDEFDGPTSTPPASGQILPAPFTFASFDGITAGAVTSLPSAKSSYAVGGGQTPQF